MEFSINRPNIFNIIKTIAMLSVFGIHSLICIRMFYPDMYLPWFLYTPAWGAMWIFFILSGYLLGKGFYSNKYKTDTKGILIFLFSRIVRILPVYLIFILIAFLFIYPEDFAKEHFYSFIPLLTFTYNIEPLKAAAKVHIGYLWFVSTIMQLYIIAPFAYRFVFKKIKFNKLIVFLLIVGCGLCIRLIYNYFKMDNMELYFNYVLLPSWTNLDLFLGGMFINALTYNAEDNTLKKCLRPFSLFLLIVVLVYFTHELRYGFSWFYKFMGPIILLIIIALIIYSFDYCNKPNQEPLSIKNIIKNPLRIFDVLGTLVFGFYIYHSYLLTVPLKICKILLGDQPVSNFMLFWVLLSAFLLTVLVAGLNYILIEKPSNKFRYSFIEREQK